MPRGDTLPEQRPAGSDHSRVVGTPQRDGPQRVTPWAMPYRESHGCVELEDPREGFTLTPVCLLSLLTAGFGN